ncbi:MAG: Ca-activated chloride channel family protein [Myxococcota bacterium]
MIEWGSPWAFWLLIPVLLLPLQRWVTGHNRLAVPSTKFLRPGFSLRRLVWWMPGVLRIVGLALLVVALARPRVTRRDVVVESDGLDMLLAIDTSGSMDTSDFQLGSRLVSRMEAAKGVLDAFVQARPYDRIGVVVFGQEAFTLVPLTLDHDALRRTLGIIDVGIAGPNKTAVGTAVAVSARRMKQVDATERIVILLTDGRNNVDRPDPLEAARAAAALDIKIYTIGVGDARGFRDSGIDEQGLTRLAELTGGQYFRARNTEGLQEVFDVIDRLETSPAQVRQLVEHDEHFRDYLVPGLLFLLIGSLLSATWLRRGP